MSADQRALESRRILIEHEGATVLLCFGALPMRLVLFALWQVVFAVLFSLQGAAQPWEMSIAWWPVSGTLANLTGLLALRAWQRRDGQTLRDLYRVGPHSAWRELLIAVGLMSIGTPLMLAPVMALGTLLFGDMQVAGEIFLRPLPMAVIIPFMVLFPLTNALSELPTYYVAVMPRLRRLTGRAWLALLLPAAFLAAQHVAMPLIFDGRYLLWRLGMFIPFALFVGICLQRRPRLLPYFLVMHGLMDLQLMLSILSVS